MSIMAEREVYVDEDRALGFHVWVAELELLVGTSKGRQIDQVKLLLHVTPLYEAVRRSSYLKRMSRRHADYCIPPMWNKLAGLDPNKQRDNKHTCVGRLLHLSFYRRFL